MTTENSRKSKVFIWKTSKHTIEWQREHRIVRLNFLTEVFHMQSHMIHDMALEFLLKEDFAVADNLVNIHITHFKLTALEDYVLDATIATKLLILWE